MELYSHHDLEVRSLRECSNGHSGYSWRSSLEKRLPCPLTECRQTFSRAATVFSLAAFLLVILDYAVDKHLDSFQSVLILTVFTVGDLMSRVSSGYVIDMRIVAHSWMMSVTFLVQGIAYLLLIYSTCYPLVLVAACFVGLTGGCRNILATVMVTEECDESRLAVNLGVMNFVTGVTIVFQPALIGEFVFL